MQSTKLILFDIGGVLVEYKNAFKTAELEQNVSVKALDDIFDKYDREITKGEITPQDLWIKCINENNLKADTDYKFLQSWVSDNIRIEYTYNLIGKLLDKYSIGLFSNIYKGFVPEMIRTQLIPDIGYKKYFLSCDMGMQKPEKETYEYVQNNSEVKSSEILFIDDKIENLLPAKDLGWKTFRFDRQNPEININKLTEMLL